jgi:phage portal protein BeeE
MYADSLAAYTDAWGAELSSKLFGPGYCIKFDKTALLRGSFNESMQAYREAVQLGVMTPNEVRRELGLPPIDGGNEMYVGPNMQATTGGSDDAEAGSAVAVDEDDDDLG